MLNFLQQYTRITNIRILGVFGGLSSFLAGSRIAIYST